MVLRVSEEIWWAGERKYRKSGKESSELKELGIDLKLWKLKVYMQTNRNLEKDRECDEKGNDEECMEFLWNRNRHHSEFETQNVNCGKVSSEYGIRKTELRYPRISGRR